MQDPLDGLKIEASSGRAVDSHIRWYALKSDVNQTEFQALYEKEKILLRVQLQTSEEQTLTSDSSFRVLIERTELHQKIELD
jgi:hypothetical protein